MAQFLDPRIRLAVKFSPEQKRLMHDFQMHAPAGSYIEVQYRVPPSEKIFTAHYARSGFVADSAKAGKLWVAKMAESKADTEQERGV